ncbi:MAG: PEP-utilizing enzyme [Candidatus Moranbacteria bacterium]|nr:PEP-utilizing enzyme [Candidatus Moranbacteria bacterium]
MKSKLLWRENFVDYLWAKHVTAKSYFFKSGMLIYEDNVLSGFAFPEEIRYAKETAYKKIGDIDKILKLESEFDEMKKEIKRQILSNLKAGLHNKTRKELLSEFDKVLDFFSKFVSKYKYLEPHVLKHFEGEALKKISEKTKRENPELVLAEIMAEKDGALRRRLFKKYGLVNEENLFGILEKIAEVRFEAKKIEREMIGYSENLLKETARRTLIAVNQISHLEYKELKELLLFDKNPDLKTVNKRNKRFGLIINKGAIKDIEDERLAEIIIKEKEKSGENNCIKGTIAYPGSVKGVARLVPIMNESEEYFEYSKSLGKEDVIITSMTSPDLTVAFDRVGGVITDEGGVMSHAALISRETKTPCLIGTGYATKFFKDGDRILLDAKQGIAYKK